ncbi:hypothetical protein [Numidum massiliense]|uniref:hypothetical protein n=1 Tax=Numidum massiliense TaxID=1522315 RepID=UPI0006D549DF|nr:hypothetical protein [Numidum massiliense]
MAGFLVFVSLIFFFVFVASLIGLIKGSLKMLRINNRRTAAVVMVVALVLSFASCSTGKAIDDEYVENDEYDDDDEFETDNDTDAYEDATDDVDDDEDESSDDDDEDESSKEDTTEKAKSEPKSTSGSQGAKKHYDRLNELYSDLQQEYEVHKNGMDEVAWGEFARSWKDSVEEVSEEIEAADYDRGLKFSLGAAAGYLQQTFNGYVQDLQGRGDASITKDMETMFQDNMKDAENDLN